MTVPEDKKTLISVVKSRREIESLIFSCERLLEVASSALVRCQSVDEKITLAGEIWGLAQAAQILHERLPGLRSAAPQPHARNIQYVRFVNSIISLQNPVAEIAALVHFGYPDLREKVGRHKIVVPELADEATLDCLNRVLEKLEILRVPLVRPPHCVGPVEAMLRGAGGDADRRQTDREATMLVALPMIPIRPGREFYLVEATPAQPIKDGGYGPILHDFAFRIELCATEICASLLAHHVDAPWGLRFDLAKQVRDEARHFELFMRRAQQLGIQPGDRPIQFEVWDKFIVGETLAERLIIEQRIGEAAALDSAENVSRRMKADGELDLALVFDYITADEVTHVANGNRWLRHMLGNDDAIAAVEEEIRKRLAHTGLPVPYKHQINVESRKLAGFSESELTRIRKVQLAERSE